MLLLSAVTLGALVPFRHAPKLGKGWEETDMSPADSHPITLQIALKRDPTVLEEVRKDLEVVSDPQSARWREWAEPEATKLAAKPARGALAAAAKWLVGAGVRRIKQRSNVLEITAPAAQMSALFGTRFALVVNRATKQRKFRAGTLHLPAEVLPHVSGIFGAHGLPLPPKKTSRRKLRAGDQSVGPTELHRVYGFNVTRGTGNIKVRQAIAEFQGQYMDQSDLSDFFTNLVPNRKTGDDQLYKVIGDVGSGDGIEALLDVEYIMGVAPGVKTEFWSFQQDDWCSDLKNWTTYMLNDPSDQPLVISVSYGWQGDLTEIGCTDSEVKDIDNDYMLLAQRGVSIIFSSGDSGSGEDGDGKLWPSWPASSPWITSVGATAFTGDVGSEQMASSQFGSGSGFSFQFPQQKWQARFVNQYLANAPNLPPNTSYAPGGRGTADVSALGENYKVYVDGSVELVGGTSASAPFFAAVISLLNDQLVAKGKKPLGYLNQWIYQTASLYTDITKGTDKIGRDGSTLDRGFDCIAGWDPATGLGTPVFSKLLGWVLSH